MNDDLRLPSTPVKGLTITELYKKSDRKVVHDIVCDHVKLIDAQIQNAHMAGFNSIDYALPTNFGINNMSMKDAQTLIYSELLMLYKLSEEEGGKGFEKVFINATSKPSLIIIWPNRMDEDERKVRSEYINSCRYTKK